MIQTATLVTGTSAPDSINCPFQQLQSTGVPVNANPPDAGPPFWQQLLLGSDRRCCWSGCSSRSPGGRLAAPGVCWARSGARERGFKVLKQWRALATRYDKHALTYRGAIVLGAILTWLR